MRCEKSWGHWRLRWSRDESMDGSRGDVAGLSLHAIGRSVLAGMALPPTAGANMVGAACQLTDALPKTNSGEVKSPTLMSAGPEPQAKLRQRTRPIVEVEMWLLARSGPWILGELGGVGVRACFVGRRYLLQDTTIPTIFMPLYITVERTFSIFPLSKAFS